MHNKNKWDNDDDYDNKTSYMHHKKNMYIHHQTVSFILLLNKKVKILFKQTYKYFRLEKVEFS